MTASEKYMENVIALADSVRKEQAGAIEAAARLAADALTGGGFLFTFGTGHSHMLAEEIFYRAGGLARVCPILWLYRPPALCAFMSSMALSVSSSPR